MEMIGIKERKKQNRYFLLLCLAAGALLFWRSFYGVVPNDEMYYVGTTNRLFRGEKLLIDEWNPTQQMCSFLLLPIFALLREILGSNEGMVLAFRFVYVAFQLLTAFYCYRRLRSHGNLVLLPLALFLLATPYNIGSMSYNTMGIGCMMMLLCALADPEPLSTGNKIFLGVCAATVVLSNPYALLLYVLYGGICLYGTLKSRKTGKPADDKFCMQTFLFITAGAVLIAVLFTLFVFSRGTVEELKNNLPMIISDQEHQQDYVYKAQRYFLRFLKHYKYTVVMTGILLPFLIFDKKRREHRAWYLALSALSAIPYIIYHGFFSDYVSINLVVVPISFPGFVAYLLAEEKKKRVFYRWFLPGILYSICVQYASNTGILAVSASLVLTSSAALLLLAHTAWEIWQEGVKWKRLLSTAAYVALAVQLLSAVYCKITYVWADAPITQLTERVERGPAKGLKTTKDFTSYYDAALRSLDAMELTSEDRLLVTGIDPWIYLYTEASCGSWSTWQVNVEQDLIYNYYALHPEKYPNVVYCPNEEESFLDTGFAQGLLEEGFQVKEAELGFYFTKEK